MIATLDLGGAPEQAVADGKGMIYNNLESTNEVIAIDSRDLKIKSRWPVAPAGQPVSIAMDRVHRRLVYRRQKSQACSWSWTPTTEK